MLHLRCLLLVLFFISNSLLKSIHNDNDHVIDGPYIISNGKNFVFPPQVRCIRGDLTIVESSFELPENLTIVGSLCIIDCDDIEKLPQGLNDIIVGGTLNIGNPDYDYTRIDWPSLQSYRNWAQGSSCLVS